MHDDGYTVEELDPWTIRGTQVYGPPIRWSGKITIIRRRHPDPGCLFCAIDLHCPKHRNPIVDQVTVPNLITTLGYNWIRTALSDSGFDPALPPTIGGPAFTEEKATSIVPWPITTPLSYWTRRIPGRMSNERSPSSARTSRRRRSPT